MQRLISNVAYAQIGILTTHAVQQLAQNCLVDFLLQYPSQTIIGGFLDYHSYKVARKTSAYSLVPGFDC